MKRLVGGSLVLAAIAFAAMTGVAGATHSNGQGPDKDTTNGSSVNNIATPFGVFPGQQHVNAQNKAAGGVGGQGHFWTVIFAGPPIFPPGTVETLSGDITCLNAVSNQSSNSGLITDSTGPVNVTGLGVIGKTVDNGEPGSDATSPDLAGGSLLPAPLAACPPPQLLGVPLFPITQGNYIVHDGI
jgi:hypothetical protein